MLFLILVFFTEAKIKLCMVGTHPQDMTNNLAEATLEIRIYQRIETYAPIEVLDVLLLWIAH